MNQSSFDRCRIDNVDLYTDLIAESAFGLLQPAAALQLQLSLQAGQLVTETT
jgi:hypothetical protein